METKPKILTPTFAVLSGTTLCFFLSMSILVPVLPKYLDSTGLPAFKVGIAFGAMSIAAIFFRPFTGREIDRRSRKLFTQIGLGLSGLACLIYPFVARFLPVIGVRVIHGAAIASFYPGASTLTADLAPPERRAEALSYFSMFLYAGFAAGPALGETIVAWGGFTWAFLTSAFLAFGGLVISIFLKEPTTRELDHDPGKPPPLLHKAAAFPALVLALSAVSFAAVGVFLPLYVSEANTGSSRWFFLTMSIAVICLRFFVGKAADRYGRAAVIIPGIVLCAASMFTIAQSPTQGFLIAGALLYGLGWGALFPGLLAMTVDRVPPNQRGSATGTFTAAFDAAFGSSPAILGLVKEAAGYPAVFIAGGIAAIASVIIFITARRRSDATHPVFAE